MVRLKGVTVATGKQLARQTCCVILFAAFPPFFYPSVLILPSLPLCPASYLSPSRDLFLHFSPHFAFSCLHSLLLSHAHTPALSNLSPFVRHPHGYALFEINFVGVLTPSPPPPLLLTLCVCLGGRGSGSLHPSGAAPDPAALQAGGESRQERFPVSQEALP